MSEQDTGCCCGASCCGGASSIEGEQKAIVRDSYSRRAQSGDLMKLSPCSVYDRIVEVLEPLEGKRVLDVGSGMGLAVVDLAMRVGPSGKAAGVDFSQAMIARAESLARSRGVDQIAEFRLADAEAGIPYEDGYFDAVITECVVNLMPNKQRVLDEIARVLKPGGRVLLSDTVEARPMPSEMREDPDLICACMGSVVTAGDYKRMLAKAGFTSVQTLAYQEPSDEAEAEAQPEGGSKKYREAAKYVGYALLVATKG